MADTLLLDVTVRHTYYRLKAEMEEAYRIFNNNPTQLNSCIYGAALNQFQDYCVSYVAKLVGDTEMVSSYMED